MMNIKILEKSNGEFYHLKCYVIRDAYHMIPATHGLIRVQGVEEDTPSNMFLLSTLNHWSFTEHIPLGPPNHDSQNFSKETYELGS